MKISRLTSCLLILPLALAAGCSKKYVMTDSPYKHVHHPPHGGIPVVLGDEAYHLELVLNAGSGTLQAYVLDGEMEEFIRSAVPSIEITAAVNGAPQTLMLKAVANPATGETVGDTSLFEAQAGWLKTTKEFDAVLKSITVRGTTFSDVKFNYPKGNDTD
jgi:hypothetical protein